MEMRKKHVVPCSTKKMDKVIFFMSIHLDKSNYLNIFIVNCLEYAQVTRMLGGGRAQLQCYDGKIMNMILILHVKQCFTSA